jgi:hypothetical protein
MKKPKSYKALNLTGSDTPESDGHANAAVGKSPVFEVEFGPTGFRRIDYTSRLDRGYDAWIWAGLDTFRALKESGSHSSRTLLNFAGAGWPRWLEYLECVKGPPEPLTLRPEHVQKFTAWLKLRYPSGTSARTTFGQVAPLISAMCSRGLIPLQFEILLPVRPFGIRAGTQKSHSALTQSETQRLANALKSDLIAIHRGGFRGMNPMHWW